MPDLKFAVANNDRICAELLARWPELAADPEALADTLEGISTLPEAIAAVYRSSLDDEQDCAAIAEQIKRLQARKKRLEERAERKQNLALWACQEGRLRRVDAPDFTLSVAASKGRVIITDEYELADVWCRIRREPDKKAIGDALRAGVDVPGAVLGNPQATLRATTK